MRDEVKAFVFISSLIPRPSSLKTSLIPLSWGDEHWLLNNLM